MDIRQLPLTYQGRVEIQHLDHLKHMNVMWYTHFFNRATWHWYESFGFGPDYHEESGFGSFALEAHERFLAELRLDDEFQIYTRMLGRNAKLFHFMHFMLRARDGELAATNELLNIHVDMATRRSAPMPEPIAAAFDALIARDSALGWEPPLSGAIHIK